MSRIEGERKEIMCLQKGLAFPFCSSKSNKVQRKDLQHSNCSIPCANHHKQEEKELNRKCEIATIVFTRKVLFRLNCFCINNEHNEEKELLNESQK